jgi:hypothetical protein
VIDFSSIINDMPKIVHCTNQLENHMWWIRASDRRAGGFRWIKMENVMKNLLLAAAIAALPFGVASAFASPTNDMEWDVGNNPTSSPCHFVREAVTMQNGRVVYERHQVCN